VDRGAPAQEIPATAAACGQALAVLPGDLERHGIDVGRRVPQNFPVLTKTEMMANFDRIVTDPTITKDKIADFLERSKNPFDLYENRYYVVSTSGTSGEIGYYVYDMASRTRGVPAALRVRPPSIGRRRLAFLGACEGHGTGVSFAVSTQRSLTWWAYTVATYEIDAPLAPTLDSLNAFRPTILTGYANALGILAEKQLDGRLNIAPKQVLSSGELVESTDRELVEQVFGVPLLDLYACSEHFDHGPEPP
jgi:phenylacetate-CoA ligase